MTYGPIYTPLVGRWLTDADGVIGFVSILLTESKGESGSGCAGATTHHHPRGFSIKAMHCSPVIPPLLASHGVEGVFPIPSPFMHRKKWGFVGGHDGTVSVDAKHSFFNFGLYIFWIVVE